MARYARSRTQIFQRRIRQIEEAVINALVETTEALHTEVVQAQVIPRDTGTLQNEKTFTDDSQKEDGKAYIVSEGPYARRLYYHPEYNFQRDKNPNAKGMWYEDWLPGGTDAGFVQNAYAHFLREELQHIRGGDRS